MPAADDRIRESAGDAQPDHMVFETAEAEVRLQHPGIGEREAFLRTAARVLNRFRDLGRAPYCRPPWG